MAQDFAKQRSNPDGNKRKRAASKPAPSSNASWSWFFSGLMTGVIVSIAAYLGALKLEEGVVESAQNVQSGTNPEDLPAFSFGFYNELANAEVAVNVPPGTEAAPGNPAPDTTGATSKPPATTLELASADEQQPVLYLLQAGAFQGREEAESRRARIILLNMNASVVQSVVSGKTLYRVQVGPFAGRQRRDDARAILAGNDIESMSLQVQ